MSSMPLSADAVRDQTELLDRLAKPVIKILIYTDDPEMVAEGGIFGIREFRRQLLAHPPAFARIDLRPPLSRNSDRHHHADHKIDDELNNAASNPYHEVWFFGVHQANKPKYKLPFPGGGGPHSELEPDEITALEDWMRIDQRGMKGIGVLVAGDHANPRPDEQPISGDDRFCPPGLDHERFFGLGRAIGKKVPRGGLLRKWEGPPTHCEDDSFNSLFPPPDQMDERPQTLNLPRFDQHGNPDPLGQPHELFQGKNGKWIQVLPDHDHEGAVILPQSFPKDIWPEKSGVQPLPRLIAYGTDHRTGNKLNILAAYDGDTAGVGRIIADSSWHHYFNTNLKFLSADNLGLSAADQIGQLYSNQVLWLAPLSIRRAMANVMVIWLATHPLMVEEISAGALNIGKLALKLLRQIATDCEIHELLVAACPERLRLELQVFNFPHEPQMSGLPTVEVILGSIIGKYFEVAGQNEESSDVTSAQLANIIYEGFEQAFIVNARAAVEFAYKSLFLLSCFRKGSLPPELTRVLQIWNLPSVTQRQKGEIQ